MRITFTGLTMKKQLDDLLWSFFNAFMLKRIGFKILKSAMYFWRIENLQAMERLKSLWLTD